MVLQQLFVHVAQSVRAHTGLDEESYLRREGVEALQISLGSLQLRLWSQSPRIVVVKETYACQTLRSRFQTLKWVA